MSSPSRTTAPTRILALPPETLSVIFEFAGAPALHSGRPVDLPTLYASSLVCQAWRHPAQRQLVRHLVLGLRTPRRLHAYCTSPCTTRFPVYGLEIYNIPVPLKAVEYCRGVTTLVLQGIVGIPAALFLHPNLAGQSI